MSKAEERALEAFPPYHGSDNYIVRRYFQDGYEQAENDIVDLIESRLSEILGDAQPKPILRMELEELIKRIKDE